jgi:Zn-dependent protease with chaperone function
MTASSLVAFGAVFVTTSFGLSLFFSVALLLGRRHLRGMGSWVERRAATATLVLPPLLAFALVAALAVNSALAILAGTDHCLAHSHHLHLCLRHGAAWASQPWAVYLVVCSATFIAARLALSLGAQIAAQRSVSILREVGSPLGCGAFLVPAGDKFAFTAGLFSPAVVMSSAAWEALEPEQREAVLVHERAHIAHGDLWLRAALGFASSCGALFLNSHALRLWELSAERICDRRAALAVDRPSTVASAMLALVRSATPRSAPEGAVFAAASHVPERIESVLREEHDGEQSSRLLLIVLSVVSLVVAIVCTTFAGTIHHTLETILG